MADAPFAVWGVGTAVADPRPWEVREFGPIYRNLAPLGYKIADLDDLYVYEVGGLLGVEEPERESDPELARLSPGARRAIERLKADAEGRPPPETKASVPASLMEGRL